MSGKMPESLRRSLEKKNGTGTAQNRTYTAEEVYKMPSSLRKSLGIEFDDEEYESAIKKAETEQKLLETARRMEMIGVQSMMFGSKRNPGIIKSPGGATPLLPYANSEHIVSAMNSAIDNNGAALSAGDYNKAETERETFGKYAAVYGKSLPAQKKDEFAEQVSGIDENMKQQRYISEAKNMSVDELDAALENGYFEAAYLGGEIFTEDDEKRLSELSGEYAAFSNPYNYSRNSGNFSYPDGRALSPDEARSRMESIITEKRALEDKKKNSELKVSPFMMEISRVKDEKFFINEFGEEWLNYDKIKLTDEDIKAIDFYIGIDGLTEEEKKKCAIIIRKARNPEIIRPDLKEIPNYTPLFDFSFLQKYEEMMIDTRQTREKAAETAKFYDEMKEKGGLYKTAAVVVGTLQKWGEATLGAPEVLGNMISDTLTQSEGYRADPYKNHLFTISNVRGQGLTEVVSDSATETFGKTGGAIATGAYQIGDSIVDNLLTMAVFQKASPYVMAAKASASAGYDAMLRGTKNGDVMKLAVATGAAEFIGEKVGWSKIDKAINKAVLGNSSYWRKMMEAAFPNFGSEFLNESATAAMNLASEWLILGDESSVSAAITEAYNSGNYSSEEIAGAAYIVGEILKEGFAGGIAGVGISGVNISLSHFANKGGYESAGVKIKKEGNLTLLINNGLKSENDATRSLAAEAQGYISKGKAVPDVLAGQLYEGAYNDVLSGQLVADIGVSSSNKNADAVVAESLKNAEDDVKKANENDIGRDTKEGETLEDSSIVLEKDENKYPYDQQEVIEGYEEAVDNEIVLLAEKVRSGQYKENDSITFGNASSSEIKASAEILGIDVSGYASVIEARQIKHIMARHGENGIADNSMRNDEDIARLKFVIDNYDDAFYGGTSSAYTTIKQNGKPRQADTVVFAKKINGTYFVVQAVPETKRKKLFIVSAFISNKTLDEIKAQFGNKTQKSRNSHDASLNSNSKTPAVTSEATRPENKNISRVQNYKNSSSSLAGTDFSANNSISQKAGVVNRKSKGTENAEEYTDEDFEPFFDDYEEFDFGESVQKAETGVTAVQSSENADISSDSLGRNGRRQFSRIIEKYGAAKASEMASAFHTFYNGARNGLSFEQVKNASSAVAQNVPELVLRSAFFSGQNDARHEAEAQRRQEVREKRNKRKGKNVDNGNNSSYNKRYGGTIYEKDSINYDAGGHYGEKENEGSSSDAFGKRRFSRSSEGGTAKLGKGSGGFIESAGKRSERILYAARLRRQGKLKKGQVIEGIVCDVVPGEHYSKDMRSVAKTNAGRGIHRTIFVSGELKVEDVPGEVFYADGAYIEDENGIITVIIQCDNYHHTPKQINDHEYIHKEFNTRRVQQAKEAILRCLNSRERAEVFEATARNLKGLSKITTTLIQEELTANVLSRMDYVRFGNQFDELRVAFWNGDDAFVQRFNRRVSVRKYDLNSILFKPSDIPPPLKAGDIFPVGSGAEAGAISTIWANNDDVEYGTFKTVSHRGQRYVIVKDADSDVKYSIWEHIPSREFSKRTNRIKEVKTNGKDNRGDSRGIATYTSDNKNRRNDRSGGRQPISDSGVYKHDGKAETAGGLAGNQDSGRSIGDQRDRTDERGLQNNSERRVSGDIARNERGIKIRRFSSSRSENELYSGDYRLPEISDSDAEELLGYIDGKYSKESAEYKLAQELTRLEKERRNISGKLKKTVDAFRIKSFAPDSEKVTEFANRIAERLGFEKHIPNVSSVKNSLSDFYKMMESFIAGELSEQEIASAARGVAGDVTRISGYENQRDANLQSDVITKKEASEYQPEHLNTTGSLDRGENHNRFTENLAAKLISSYLQVGGGKTRFSLPSIETLTEKVFSCEEELSKIRESIPSESIEELRKNGQALKVQLKSIDTELEGQKKKTPYARLMAAQDEVFRELSEREQTAKEKLSDYKAERREREQKEKLLRVIRELRRAKTDKETRALIGELYGKYDTVGISISEEGLLNLSALKADYEFERENNPNFVPSKKTEREIERLSKVQIANLSASEVAVTLEETMALSHGIKNQNFIIEKGERRSARKAADEGIAAVRNSGGMKYENGALRTAGKFDMSLLSPARFFKKILGYDTNNEFYKRCEALNDGQRKAAAIRQDCAKLFESLVSSKDKKEDKRLKAELRDFTGEHAREYDIGIISAKGKHIYITPAQKVALHLSAENPDFLRHAFGGGITFPDITLMKKGKLQEAYARGEKVILSPSEIARITSELTEYEKVWADAAREFFNVKSKKYVNEASELLYGYEIANVENYFPINVSRNYIATDFESLVRDSTLEGKGFLKERTENSKPVNLEDITSVLNRHISDVSAFAGLALPIRNFQTVYNAYSYEWDDSLKGVIEKKWGPDANKYIENLITDFQSPRKRDEGFFGFLDKLRSLRAAAVMSVNIPVTLGNLAAYPQAAGVLGWEAVGAASANREKIKFDEELVEKYTPLYNERRSGFTVRELGDIREQGNIIHRISALERAFGMMQGVDLVVTRRIWLASEYYIRKNSPGLSVGSKEYYKAVAEIFNKTLEETQPMYSVYQRPEILRSTNAFTREFTMFKSALLQNYNVMYDSVAEYRAVKKNGSSDDVAKAGKKMMNVLSSQITAGLVVATMNLTKIILTAGTAYRDDEDELTALSVATGFGKDFVSNFTSMIPGLDDSIALCTSLIEAFGVDIPGNPEWYDLNASAFEMINSFKMSIESVISATLKYKTGEVGAKSVSKAVYKLAESVSQMFGIPLKNTVGAFWNTVCFGAEAFGGKHYGDYIRLKMTGDAYKSSTLGDMTKCAYAAYADGDMDIYKKIKSDMINSGYISNDKFVKKMKSFEKEEKFNLELERFQNGELPGNKVSDALIKELYENEINKAARRLANGDKDGALEIIGKVSKKSGIPAGRFKVIVNNKAANY